MYSEHFGEVAPFPTEDWYNPPSGGINSIAIGESRDRSCEGSVVMGANVEVIGKHSFVAGKNLVVKGNNCFIIGHDKTYEGDNICEFPGSDIIKKQEEKIKDLEERLKVLENAFYYHPDNQNGAMKDLEKNFDALKTDLCEQ